MKIYTKTGDKGQTSLIGGTRVPKYHLRIESYGTVDELNSYIGLIADQDNSAVARVFLREIQDRLFTLGSLLAEDVGKSKMKLPQLSTTDVEVLEHAIDAMNETLPDLKSFILPGGNTTVSYCHVARCICRRAERLVVHLSEDVTVDATIVVYLNRLSDYLFTLARYIAHLQGVPDIEWHARIN
jgi:cob(I)alamin adenosyltransferase